MSVIELVENAPSIEVELDPVAGAALARAQIIQATPSLEPNRWTVAALSKVGVARIGSTEIRVRPKLPIGRLFFLLGFAINPSYWRSEDILVAEAPDLVSAVAEAFWRQADRAVSHGLIQGYRVVEDASTVLRGRLREADQMRLHFGLAIPLEIRFDEYTVDVAENQLLKGAAQALLRLPGIGPSARTRLVRLAVLLADVSAPVRGHPLPIWRPSRLNTRYHTALGLAELILSGTSVDQWHGQHSISGFMVDMARVFEDFLGASLGAALAASGGAVRTQDRTHHLDIDDHIPLRPDLVWYPQPELVGAVVDAKYKAEKPSGFPNADVYQMLAYCTVLGLRTGHLVYAKGYEPEQRHVVRNAGVEVLQHALDLDQAPGPLLAQVGELGQRIVEAAAVEGAAV
jgi:5-methylcytosine-specific restriction enzyme subunit McrC